MATRKTDFNTEDIMGSLLGMDRREKDVREDAQMEKEEPSPPKEKEAKTAEKITETEETHKRETVYMDDRQESEYIPIDSIRIRRKDEKEMKVPVSFSLSRKTAEQLKQIAYIERLSSSEIVSGLIEAYIKAHQNVLLEYQDLLDRRKI